MLLYTHFFAFIFYNKSTVRNFFDFTLPKIFSDNNQNIKTSKNFYINILKNKEKTIIILFISRNRKKLLLKLNRYNKICKTLLYQKIQFILKNKNL